VEERREKHDSHLNGKHDSKVIPSTKPLISQAKHGDYVNELCTFDDFVKPLMYPIPVGANTYESNKSKFFKNFEDYMHKENGVYTHLELPFATLAKSVHGNSMTNHEEGTL
jgi:hypothetical protein